MGGEFAGDNVYAVTVVANKGESTLVVTVTDVEEEGEVTIRRPQPQVEVSIGAARSDPDGDISSATWQWAGSSDMQTWTDIENATSMSYTPKESDEGNYLRATVSYTDRRGPGKTASAITENPVEEKTLANAAPIFPKEDDSALDEDTTDKQDGTTDQPFMRSVAENTKSDTAIGNPVAATDDDSDILLYSISGGVDMDHFDIDERTGQIKTKGKLNFEAVDGAADAPAGADGIFAIQVTAEDPSLATNDPAVEVRIHVTDMNEAPSFTAAYQSDGVDGRGGDRTLTGGTTLIASGDAIPTAETYAATDADSLPDADDANQDVEDLVTMVIEGPDKGTFTLGTVTPANDLRGITPCVRGRQESGLTRARSEYSITIVAKDSNAGSGESHSAAQ